MHVKPPADYPRQVRVHDWVYVQLLADGYDLLLQESGGSREVDTCERVGGRSELVPERLGAMQGGVSLSAFPAARARPSLAPTPRRPPD